MAAREHRRNDSSRAASVMLWMPRIRRPSPAAVMAVALLLTAAAYWPGLHGEFEFDDYPNIVKVDALHVSQASLRAFRDAALVGNAGQRPLAYLSFALNHYFFGLDPFYFKFVNLVIHLANGVLLFLLGRILLAEMLCYAAGRQRMLTGGRGRALIAWGSCGFGLLALATKEIAVLMPAYLLVMEVTAFRWRAARMADRKFLQVFFALALVLPALAAGLYLLSGPGWFVEGYQDRGFTVVERLMTEARVLWFYLSLIVYPDIARMGLYHDDIAPSHGLLAPPTTLFSILGLIVLPALAVRSLRRMPPLALAIGWFLAGHALE